MPELPEEPQLTRDAMYASYERKAQDWRRNHLGASVIGQECERSIWYGFRWCTKPNFDGRMLRLFETGHNQEARLLNDLRNSGVEVICEENGEQIHYTDFGGHYSGSLDAVCKGLAESPEKYHVVECKSMNAKTFAKLKDKGVHAVKPEHFAQMQVYMGWSGIDRAFYVVVCKDTEEIYTERVRFDQGEFDRLRLKADRIIFSDEPPERISTDIANFKCRFCNHKWSCHDKRLPEVNCRTCAFAEVLADGAWGCTRLKCEISSEQQRSGCKFHAFLPGLVPLKQVDADPGNGWIIYEGGIINGYGATASEDLQELIV